MMWLLAFVLALLFLTPLVIAYLAGRRHGVGGVLVVVGMALVAVGTMATGWPYVVMATAISAVVVLGISVMLQRIPPLKAVGSALAGLVLLFPCVWLVQRMGDIFLLQKTPIPRPSATLIPYAFQVPIPNIYWPSLFCAAALGGLVASRFLDRRAKLAVVFLCVMLLLYFAPQWLEHLQFPCEHAHFYHFESPYR